MKKFIAVLMMSLIVISVAVAQRPIYDRKNNMIAMYEIGVGDGLDVDFCSVEKITGTILSVSEDYPEVITVIRTTKGNESISVNTERMSMADRSNFFYGLLKKGKKVHIGAYMCGSGAFYYATSVKSLTPVGSPRGKKT